MNNYFSALLNGNTAPFFLIAGPCVIENYDTTFRTAAFLKKTAEELDIPFIFKSSFDKANRSSADSYRGPGIEKGLDILKTIKQELEVRVTSDIHLPHQAREVSSVLDIIQIPAFLCRQTDLITDACRTGKPVNIKKGQFLSPWECKNIIHKATNASCADISITERGTTFGYNNLVVDFRSIKTIKEMNIPVIFDATHSVQLPGKGAEISSGDRTFAPFLARAAVAAGADGLFIETHPDPDNALCDGPNSLGMDEIKPLLIKLKRIGDAVKEDCRDDVKR